MKRRGMRKETKMRERCFEGEGDLHPDEERWGEGGGDGMKTKTVRRRRGYTRSGKSLTDRTLGARGMDVSCSES